MEDTTRNQDAAKQPIEKEFQRLDANRQGLSAAEATRRLAQYGQNVIAEEQASALLKFLGYFWGPIPWMIEVAAVLSALVGHWADLSIILVLLVFNAAVGFWQEYQAGNAIEQLKKRLALQARVLRDGQWSQVAASNLVPGDIVRIRLGEIVPADVLLLDGDYLSVDQSSLTGESLPVEKRAGEAAYSGSIAKQGEMVALVTATGMNTYFGKTAQLVGAAHHVSHFQKAVLSIGDYLIYLSLGLVALLTLVELHRHEPLLTLAQFALILTVAAIPVAMPAVLSVTMAVGAVALSRMKAIVSRLESIEEMAGIDVLCCDKTGTLTENRLTMGDPMAFGGIEAHEVVLSAVLASKSEDQDAIDLAIIEALPNPDAVKAYRQQKFVPFDPVHKRTEAIIRDPEGATFQVSKGAPQVILSMCGLDVETRTEAERQVEALARKGYRTLGVARSDDGERWRFLGLLPLYDPPRPDAAQTLAQARQHGIQVKMITGDNVAIGREIAGQLDLGNHLLRGADLAAGTMSPEQVEAADGFAEVFPEHKFAIVKAFQGRGHLVGMTGDGVNDAPALRQAEVGIAVSGATDAARAAADLVLTSPGLRVVVQAVEQARRIFERMNSYAIYRITETIRIMIFVVLTMLVYNFYPITTVMIVLLALLNDLPIMTIAYDNTWLDPRPVRWDMQRVLTIATVLGGIGVVETFGLLFIAIHWLGLSHPQLQSLVFLKLAVAGHLTLFVARTRRPFLSPPYPSPLLLAAVLSTQTLAALAVGFGWFVSAIPWAYVALVWGYALAWIFIEDAAKLLVYRHLGLETRRHRKFLDVVQQRLAGHPGG